MDSDEERVNRELLIRDDSKDQTSDQSEEEENMKFSTTQFDIESEGPEKSLKFDIPHTS